ncbi:MAG: PqqD family protein [Acidobacteriota bacterium]|nr:PqqD family protein [Acidobacteriota bacterium]
MSARLFVSPDALARDLNGEVLVLDLRSSQYFGLTGTGARVWQLVESGHDSADAITDTLAAEFDADPERIKEDVERFLDDLVARGLLVGPPA